MAPLQRLVIQPLRRLPGKGRRKVGRASRPAWLALYRGSTGAAPEKGMVVTWLESNMLQLLRHWHQREKLPASCTDPF